MILSYLFILIHFVKATLYKTPNITIPYQNGTLTNFIFKSPSSIEYQYF